MEAPSEVLELPLGRTGLEDEWLALAASTPHSSYFQTPDWVLSWWEALSGRPFTRVATWRSRDGGLEAIAAISRVHERLHRSLPFTFPVWINAGSGPGAADHCGWPALSDRVRDVHAWIGSQKGTVVLSNLDPQSGVTLVPPSFRHEGGTNCPRLTIPADLDLLGRSGHFRRHLRHSQRRLAEAGVIFRPVPPDEMTPEVLEQVMAVHQARRSQTGWNTTFTPDRLDFHRRLLSRAAPGRGPAAILAQWNGQTVGALYGFWWQDTFVFYQGGWDDRWSQYSLGTVLNAEAIVYCARRGARIYDFLRGEEDYKVRFGATSRTDETWMRARGLAGLLLKLKSRARRGSSG